jgi:hypothetical protein
VLPASKRSLVGKDRFGGGCYSDADSSPTLARQTLRPHRQPGQLSATQGILASVRVL